MLECARAHTQLLGLACVYVWREVACQGLHSQWVCNDEVCVAAVTVGWTRIHTLCKTSVALF